MPPKKKPQPLTLKELNILEFIEGFMQHQGVVPTYQEIREHFGFASFNSVQRYLKQLQGKNYIHIPGGNQKRAMQILHPSNTFSNLLADRTHDASVLSTNQQHPHLSQLKKETSPKRESPPQVESLSLPLLGRVAAGLPIEAFSHDEFIEVPSSMIRNPSKTFALIVQGQSMIEDGIFDGDVVFVQKQTYAGNGETVVAMINNQATIKRIYLHTKKQQDVVHTNPQSDAHKFNDVELRPANSTMQSMWYPSNDVDIQGVLVGLLRRF